MKSIAIAALFVLGFSLAADGGTVSGSGHGDTRAQACEAARSSARGEARSDAMLNHGTALFRITGYGPCECDQADDRWTCAVTARYEVGE